MYRYKLINDLEVYIEDELQGSMYYSQLADEAPTELAKKILLEFSSDEKSHAESFQQAYYYLTGKMYSPNNVEILPIPGFQEALKKRLSAETRDYKKYGEQYLDAPTQYLNNLFFMIKAVEARHAMRIPLLFDECRTI